MKNVIKKIASVAMAFTLLGTGAAVTKTIAPETTNNTITAYAIAYCPNHSGVRSEIHKEFWYKTYDSKAKKYAYTFRRVKYYYCAVCGRSLGSEVVGYVTE